MRRQFVLLGVGLFFFMAMPAHATVPFGGSSPGGFFRWLGIGFGPGYHARSCCSSHSTVHAVQLHSRPCDTCGQQHPAPATARAQNFQPQWNGPGDAFPVMMPTALPLFEAGR